MESLVVLMMEEEQPEGLSARKLVVETAKHNVLTAYSVNQGMKLLQRFPKVDAVVVHCGLIERNPGLLSEIRKVDAGLPIIVADPVSGRKIEGADYVADSHNPTAVLTILREKITPRY